MYKSFLRTFFFIVGMGTSFMLQAQETATSEKPQMADGMRSDGKIYVVVAVLMIILTGLFVYVIRLDRKISRLEKNKP